uniref:Putative ovule protein n=1 Tax=Solanum chacoense TaxID=4108 RepID=A0A0V0GQK5_SOLCH
MNLIVQTKTKTEVSRKETNFGLLQVNEDPSFQIQRYVIVPLTLISFYPSEISNILLSPVPFL